MVIFLLMCALATRSTLKHAMCLSYPHRKRNRNQIAFVIFTLWIWGSCPWQYGKARTHGNVVKKRDERVACRWSPCVAFPPTNNVRCSINTSRYLLLIAILRPRRRTIRSAWGSHLFCALLGEKTSHLLCSGVGRGGTVGGSLRVFFDQIISHNCVIYELMHVYTYVHNTHTHTHIPWVLQSVEFQLFQNISFALFLYVTFFFFGKTPAVVYFVIWRMAYTQLCFISTMLMDRFLHSCSSFLPTEKKTTAHTAKKIDNQHVYITCQATVPELPRFSNQRRKRTRRMRLFRAEMA